MKAIAYYRVSTVGQGQAGNGLEAQRQAVQEWAAAQGYELAAEFVEVESGRKNYRPQLLGALAQCRESGAVLVCSKLDRLARNATFIANLMDSPVRFVALDVPSMDDPDTARLTLQLLASMADFEARRISRRTRDGLAQVAKSKKLGSPRPEIGAAAAGRVMAQKAQQNADRVLPYIEKLRGYGCNSLRSIAQELNNWRVPIRFDANNQPVVPDLEGGRQWQPQQVKNILDRAGLVV